MLYDGINLTSGSSVFNLEIENVATLPAAVADGLGRMVYLTSAYSTYSVGPYVNDGTIWLPIQTTAGVSSVTINNGTGITGGGTGSTFTLAVDTNVIATKTYADSAGASAITASGGIQKVGNEVSLTSVGTAGVYGDASTIPTLTIDSKGRITSVVLNPVVANVSTAGDSYFNSVSLLMHAEGTNGSSSFVDSSATPKTVSIANGTPTISTTQSKFGSSSIQLVNTGSAANTSDSLRIASGGASGPMDLSTGDFTIEFFMRAAAAQTTRLIMGSANALTGTGGWGIRLDSTGFVLLGNGNGQGSAAWSWNTNTWYHVAVCRSGSTTKIFVDGTQVGSNLTPTFVAESAGSYVYIGAHNTDSYNASYGFNGHLDEIRITKGVARYTTNFTAPTTAFLNQASLVNGVYTNATITNTGNANYPTLSVASAYTPYDVSSCVIGKPDAAAVVAYIVSPRAFNIPNGYTASVAKSVASATSSSVFTVNKNGSSIGTFTFSAGGTTAAWSGTGGSIVAGDVISIVAPATQDATLANIAFTIAGNLQ